MISRRSFIVTAVAGSAVGRLAVKREVPSIYGRGFINTAPRTLREAQDALNRAYSQAVFTRAEGYACIPKGSLIQIDPGVIKWDGKRLCRP